MKIKSARFFRKNYMTDIRHIKNTDEYDLSYIGCTHKNGSNSYVKGFFDLYHGDKANIDGFLSNFLKIAEDNQAIYEFLQNAADCDSSLFYLFYNEEYFLAINNGSAFNQTGLRSILNVAQSPKSDSMNIGRFGIGFKLVHRLVGAGDGLTELTKDYKGPVLFSWSNKKDLMSLMKGEEVEPVDDVSDTSGLPYLLKLIITNFPAEMGEVAKDLEYKDRILFSHEEYKELAEQVNKCLSPYIDNDNLDQGSLFFLKLGKGKKEKLDEDYEANLKTGIEYSLNTLHNLSNVKINGTQIVKIPLELINGKIAKDSDEFKQIDPEYKDYDIHYTVGYNKIDFEAEDPYVAVNALKKSPTFYKYFPLGDEIHGSALFIHSDSFNNETNRRKLHEDPTNKNLFPEIAKFIIKTLKDYNEKGNYDAFMQLYANILLTDEPHGNSSWLKEVLYDKIQSYISTCIPTENGYSTCSDNVKIKKVSCSLPLSVVNDEYQWFKWSKSNEKVLIDAAKDKLSLSAYDIVDMIENCDVEKVNDWISSTANDEYEAFLDELNSTERKILSNTDFLEKIKDIKLFKFSDGNYYSYNDIVSIKHINIYPYTYIYDIEKPIIYTTNKIVSIREELKKLGFGISELNLDSYLKIKECFSLPKDSNLFEIIAEKIKQDTLSFVDKKNLFLQLSAKDTSNKLEGIGAESLKSLMLFHNNDNTLTALSELIGGKYDVPSFISKYAIKKDEYFEGLDSYLMPEKDVYREVIIPNWDSLTSCEDKSYLYTEVIRLYNIDPDHNPVLTDKKYILTEDGKFVSKDDIFYNKLVGQDGVNYKCFSNAVKNIFNKNIPDKDVVYLLLQKPFDLTPKMLTELDPDQAAGISSEDMSTVLAFCEKNNESFFNVFVISKEKEGYFVKEKSKDYVQVCTKDINTKAYIKEHCSDKLIILPRSFDSYSSSENIIKGDALCKAILKLTDNIDDNKESLINIIKYTSRKDFILSLDEIKYDLDADTTADSFQYKVIEMAGEVLEDESDLNEFREKFNIQKDGVNYFYDEFNQVKVERFSVKGALKKFDMAKILPDRYENDMLLTEFVDDLVDLGIDKDKLNKLLGITNDVDIDEIYQSLTDDYPTLVNEQQLAFYIAYNDLNVKEGKAFEEPKLYDINDEKGGGAFCVSNYSFIKDCYVLSDKYSKLGKYISLPCHCYIQKPYIDKDYKFVSTDGLNTEDENKKLDSSKAVDLLSYLFELYSEDKDNFKKVDWSEYSNYLGFNPEACVLSSKYAISSEQLPEYVQKWHKGYIDKKNMLSAMGVLTISDTVIKFRRYMSGVDVDFDSNSLYKCDNYNDLVNSLEWISDKEIFPLSEEKYKVLETAVEVINKIKENGDDDVCLSDEIDFDELYNSSLQYSSDSYKEWKEETGFSIYTYDDDIPHNKKMEEYTDDTVYKYNTGTVAVDEEEKNIYVKQDVDLQDSLLKIATSYDCGLTTENVYKLFNKQISEISSELESLKEENKKLRELVESKGGNATLSAKYADDISYDDRPEYNELARKKVKQRLESEDFVFKYGIGDCSIIPGVFDPEGNRVSLIVKSCRYGKLFLNPNEWGELLRPNAMLWCYDGRECNHLHLRSMIMNQDKLLLTLDTCNLNDVAKVSEFAKILKYFKDIHFEFDSIRPTAIAESYKEYAFDDRQKDEEPTEDDYN